MRFVRADLKSFDEVQRLANEVDHVDVLVTTPAGASPGPPMVDSDLFDSTSR